MFNKIKSMFQSSACDLSVAVSGDRYISNRTKELRDWIEEVQESADKSLSSLGGAFERHRDLLARYKEMANQDMLDKMKLSNARDQALEVEIAALSIRDIDSPEFVCEDSDKEMVEGCREEYMATLGNYSLPVWERPSAIINGANAGGVLTGLATGGLTGIGIYAGVGMFCSASTGTAIKTLTGIARYNAIMARLGGGSIATGGWGVAGGWVVLGSAMGVVAAGVTGYLIAKNVRGYVDGYHQRYEDGNKLINKLTDLRVYLSEIDSAASNIHYGADVLLDEAEKQMDLLAAKESSRGHFDSRSPLTLLEMAADVLSTPLFQMEENEQGEMVPKKPGEFAHVNISGASEAMFKYKKK